MANENNETKRDLTMLSNGTGCPRSKYTIVPYPYCALEVVEMREIKELP